MIFHVHVYELKAKGEIEVDADSEASAMRQALDKTDQGKVAMDQKPERKHIAMAFLVSKHLTG